MTAPTAVEIAWAAGIFEGEGSISIVWLPRGGYPILKVTMTDLDVMQRFAAVTGIALAGPYAGTNKPFWAAQANGKRAVGIAQTFFPFLGERRREQVRKALTEFFSYPTGAAKTAARRANKTHCVNGHELTAATRYVRPYDLVVQCRACAAERSRARRLMSRRTSLHLGMDR